MRSIKNRGGLTRGRGMTESKHDLLVGTMHKCGEVHHSMESLTRQWHQSSEQHVKMSTTCHQRDNSDTKLFIELLHQLDPFLDDSRLRCISTGVAAGEDDAINCDKVEQIGTEIQQSLDGIAVSKRVVPRSKHIKNLVQMSSGTKVREKVRDGTTQINETVLFQ